MATYLIKMLMHICLYSEAFPGSSEGKESVCSLGDLGSVPGWENPLEKEMATHSSILA